MPEYLRPGVYVQEGSSGAKPIDAASTSTAAFVGETMRGRPNQPTFITSWFQFTDAFGDWDNSKDLPLSVYQFFLNGGKRAYVVRVLPRAAATAANADAITIGGKPVTINAAGAGLWGNQVLLLVSPNSIDSSRFDFEIQSVGGPNGPETVETWSSLGGREDGDRFYASIINRDSNYLHILPDATGNFPEGAPAAGASPAPAPAAAPTAGGRPAPAAAPAPAAGGPIKVALKDGTDGAAGVAITATDFATALESLNRITDVSLLVIPGSGNDLTVVSAGLAHVKQRMLGDVFYIIDPPGSARDTRKESDQIVAVKAFIANAAVDKTVANAAIYFPWVEVADPYSKVSGATRFTH